MAPGDRLPDGGPIPGLGLPDGPPWATSGGKGLLVAKTGPTANNASSGAVLKGAEGETVKELGYDIRKGGAPGSAIG